jgi:site-specific DNA recombinase
MSRARTEAKVVPGRTIRCAIYTRKSSEEGLAQEFNSLDAQRESAESFIASQKSDGWIALPERYDDGGFSGGNMDRPALDRLLVDIRAGRVDCVVVYKVDRLSRSLLDFARIMETFERHQISFVSVTQHFNTTHSMGRLTLNILLSFAQFEREIIGERIRDKIAAQRRKGKWAGGVPVLGYDIDRSGPSPHLVVNQDEAPQVRHIFDLYLKHGTLLPTVQELNRCGIHNKRRTTVHGKVVGGKPFDKTSLYTLLTNPIYIGKIVHKSNVYDGEHEAIVPPLQFKKVADQMQGNRRAGNPEVRNRHGALLRGLLHCTCCGRAMVHTFAGKVGKKGQHYRYYVCTNSIKRGRGECPAGSLPAGEIERFVLEQVQAVAHDPELLADVLQEARAQSDGEIRKLEDERNDIIRVAARLDAEIRKIALTGSKDEANSARIADLYEKIRAGERRLSEINALVQERKDERINPADVTMALKDFEGVWRRLSPREQISLFALLIDQVAYDARKGTVTVRFHEAGFKALAGEHGDAA